MHYNGGTPLCVGKISKDFCVVNMKNTRLYGYFYDFSVDSDGIAVDVILDIHKYALKKNNMIKKCLDLSRKYLL